MASDELYESPFRKLPFGIKPKFEPGDPLEFEEEESTGYAPVGGDETEKPVEETDPTIPVKPTKPGDVIPPPGNIVIKEQIIQYQPDGTQTVDVIIEFDIAPGAVVEHRQTKI